MLTSMEMHMSWLRRLLGSPTKSKAPKGHSRSRSELPTMPTVKFDPAIVSKGVKDDLRRNVELLPDLQKKHVQIIYESALRSVLAGGDLHVLSTALMTIEGMTRGRAAEISRSLNSKARAMIDRERQSSLGITHAKWLYPNAPCMKNPKQPLPADIQQDSAHQLANGKKYEIKKGLFIDGKWTWPGVEEGCKCSSRAVLPGFED